jgi:hypothetical protein
MASNAFTPASLAALHSLNTSWNKNRDLLKPICHLPQKFYANSYFSSDILPNEIKIQVPLSRKATFS